MGEDLTRRTHSLACLKISEPFGRLPHSFAASIGQRGQRVPQQFPLGLDGRIRITTIVHGDKTTLDARRRKVWPGKSALILLIHFLTRQAQWSQVLSSPDLSWLRCAQVRPNRLSSAATMPSIIGGASIVTAGIW